MPTYRRYQSKQQPSAYRPQQHLTVCPRPDNSRGDRYLSHNSRHTQVPVPPIYQDAQTRYFNQARREDRMAEANDERQQEFKRISEGYWRANTIFDLSEHEGFIAIKPVKSSYLILDIPIENETFHFVIDNKKQY